MHISEILVNEYKKRYFGKKYVFLRSILLYYRDLEFRVLTLIIYTTKGTNLALRKYCRKKLYIKYGVAISLNTTIGDDLQIGHFNGIVIGPGAIIGNGCKIYQQVTIGQQEEKYPVIGNNVTIYTGAKIIGGIHIGDNVTIGANAVVVKDVPNHCTAVGVPARYIQGK